MSKRICVIGGGRWGRNHIRTLNKLGCLGGIVEKDPGNQSRLKEEYPEIPFFNDASEAVNYGFDGFTVATPAETHFPIAEYLIQNKQHVLVEKPFTLTLSDARKLKALAEQNKVNVMVGHVLLFHPAIRKIKDLVQSGKIGKLEYLYSNRLNLGTVRTEENILWSFAPHDIAIFQYLVEQLPEEIVCRGGAFVQPQIQDTTMTVLTYPNNIVGHIFVSWLHPFKEQRLVVIGSKGMLSFEDSSQEKELYFYEKGIDWVQGEPIKRDGPTEIIAYDSVMPLTEEMQYFADHLNSDPVLIANSENAVDVLEILERATQSLMEDSVVPLKQNNQATPEQSGFFVHPTSFVDDNVKVGEGTKIWHYSHVQSGSEIGEKCTLGQNVNVANNVKMGNYVKIQNNVSVYEGVELEDYVFCGPSMVFTNIMQPRCEFPQRGSEFYEKTLVRKSASLGANSTIVCGTTIGQYAFVGAGSVVTKDVPDFALVVGNPAKFHSWVCKCGKKLSFEASEAVCGQCSRTYALKDEKVFEVNEMTLSD